MFGDRKALDKASIEVPEGAFPLDFRAERRWKNHARCARSPRFLRYVGHGVCGGFDAKEEPDKVRKHIGLISHNPMLYPDLTAMENLMFTAQLYGVVNAEGCVRELLRAVELDHRRFDVVRTLLARHDAAPFHRACPDERPRRGVFLTSPTPVLTPHAVEIFDGLIEQLRDGRTFIMVSHDLQKGFDVCTHALVLARGRVVSYAPKEDIDFGAVPPALSRDRGNGGGEWPLK